MIHVFRIGGLAVGIALVLSGVLGGGPDPEVPERPGLSYQKPPWLQALEAAEAKCGEELCDTAKELEDAAQEHCVPVPLRRKFTGRVPDSQHLFVVAHLASENRGVQKKAVEILQRFYGRGEEIRASAFARYLGPEWPLDVRVLAFAYHAKGYSDPHPDPNRMFELVRPVKALADVWNENSEIYTEIVNEVVAQPICHPELALALSACYKSVYRTGTFASIVEKDQHQLLIRRMLLLMSKGAENEGRTDRLRGEIKCLLETFDRDLLDEELGLWYRMEPDPEVRKKLFGRFASRWGLGGTLTQPGLVGLLEVAAQEEDEYIAARAQNYLRIARRELQELKTANEEK